MPFVLTALFSSKKFVVTLVTVLTLATFTALKVITPADMLRMLTFVVPAYLASQGLADIGKEMDVNLSEGDDPEMPVARGSISYSEALARMPLKDKSDESLTGPATSDMTAPKEETSGFVDEVTKPEVDPFAPKKKES